MDKGPMTISVRTQDEDAWRRFPGQADMDDWCVAHGWNSADIVSGSVVVSITSDDLATLTAERCLRDAEGRNYMDADDENRLASEVVTSPLMRALPRDIGDVS